MNYQRTISTYKPTMNHIPIKIEMTSIYTQQYTLTTKVHYPAGTMGLYPESPWGIQMKQEPKYIQDLL